MNFNLDSVSQRPGHIAIVTGANTGLGFVTALELAKKSIKVILACRNEERANDAAGRIKARVKGAELDVMLVDLSSLDSVRDFAIEFRRRHGLLHLLINNAGILRSSTHKTVDGFEAVLGANYLGHFLLTAELLDLMPDSSESRVISLGSVAHKIGHINFDDIHLEQKYSNSKAYAQSKLACIMFSDELQRRLARAGRNVLAAAAHPGGSLTELNRDASPFMVQFTQWFLAPTVTHSVRDGAMPTLAVALTRDIQGGEYIGPTRRFELVGPPGIAKRSKEARDTEIGRRLFDLSERLTGTRYNLKPG